ncbi:RNA-directed DNA polymerase [Aurantiacibacter atlanticus]|uniref:RNA-directed DNA polymerase n=1 Tax=Aurantiacibacter atlanticus TaxID=1648404 RepID=UPI000B028402|nr:RNA-directed DNA polymerase [Aurantiacibacter atlanticus]
MAHGKEASKADQAPDSKENPFNNLDYFVQRCQSAETRGVEVGSDAFRIIAEFIGSEIDRKLVESAGNKIVGGARHVDDFFLGVRTESDAQVVLSALRSVLSEYHFQLNDSKTKIVSGLVPLNEIWAQDLRRKVAQLSKYTNNRDRLVQVLNESTELAGNLGTDSPVKIFLRGVDEASVYDRDTEWGSLEPYLQRICFHHAHCIDYVFLLVVKRFATGRKLDTEGWCEVANELIRKAGAFGHDHEMLWSLWLLVSLRSVFHEDLGFVDKGCIPAICW